MTITEKLHLMEEIEKRNNERVKEWHKQNDILKIVADYPGIRKREIASSVGCWIGDLLKPMAELERAGAIVRKSYRDFANMEFYDMWFVAE